MSANETAKGTQGEVSGNVEKRMRLPSAETRITISGIARNAETAIAAGDAPLRMRIYNRYI